MVFIAAATCENEKELNALKTKIQPTMIRPEIAGLNIHIEYEPSPRTLPYEVDATVKLLTEAFEAIGTHGISIIP